MKDLQAGVVALCQELGEFLEPVEALQHLLAASQELFECDRLAIFNSVLEPFSLKPVGGLMRGLDSSQASWFDRFYLQSGAYRRDLLNQAMRKQLRGIQASRAEDLVAPAEWVRDSVHQEIQRVLGSEQVLGAVAPLQDGAMVMSLHRSSGSIPFSEEARQALDSLMRLTILYFRAFERGGALFPPRSEPTLPPRLERLLGELLRGEAEKEIARKVGLSPRTIHKYVEDLYRFYGVSSRAQLMALFVQPPEARWWAPGFRAAPHNGAEGE